MPLPEEVDEFVKDMADRAEKLHFEWWRLKLGSDWNGGLSPEHQQQMDLLAQLLRTVGRPVFGAANGR